MSNRSLTGKAAITACALLCAAGSGAATAQPTPPRFSVGLEGGGLWFANNEARIPGDSGTKFDVTRFTGEGPVGYARIGAAWQVNDRHSIHLVYAPLRIRRAGQLAQDTDFEGETFQAGDATGTYQFNAWKLTYRYSFDERGAWQWGAGFTGVVRDAEIALEQGDTEASNDNVGFVPTLHLFGHYRINERWGLRLEFDGLAGGPGRLFDVAIKLDHELTRHWQLGVGYRTLEGGADTDSVYNFAWLNYALAEIRYRY